MQFNIFRFNTSRNSITQLVHVPNDQPNVNATIALIILIIIQKHRFIELHSHYVLHEIDRKHPFGVGGSQQFISIEMLPKLGNETYSIVSCPGHKSAHLWKKSISGCGISRFHCRSLLNQ